MAEGHCEAPCVKSRSQNWDLTSWKSRPKSFQVSVLETASVKIQAPKLRSQVLKTMSWKSYPKISLEQKLPSFVTDSPDWTQPVTPFFRSALECPNLNFAHRLGTGNSALRLALGPGS